VRSGPVRLILLDSLLFIDLPWGKLGRAQRAWLQTYLRVSDDTPTLLFLHHPIAGKDSLFDGRAFWDLIKPMAKVKAVVHGHSHIFNVAERDGIHVIGLPATGYNTYDRDPVGWMDAHLTKDYGDFFLHAIDGNTRLDGTARRLRWRT
jgi:3',5'-cyclic AMP phosphodiesterase CpdA